MAFDDKTRNRLNSFVTQARELLTKEFTQQCQVDFGLNPKTGEIKDLTSLRFDDEKRQTAIILRETIAHYYANLPTKSKKTETDNKVLIERVIREQAFTILNRLCAVRMAEARDLIIESVAKGVQSKGFQLYQHVVGPSLGDTAAAYEQYLFSLFDEFAIDLAVLFDRFSPQGRLFPRDTVLMELLGLINDPEINHLWAEDETIGWIYQYFNSKEERKAMRDASQAPRNSRELAVRNQFFTPRYVVEFLTDNTLGRIWYEMRQGNMPWVDDCKYLVRRPDEVFLAESTCEDREFVEEGVVAVAKQLQSGTEVDFPEFSASTDDEVRRMIKLAHTVSAYTTLGDQAYEILSDSPSRLQEDRALRPREGFLTSPTEAASAVRASDFTRTTTQQIVNTLFMTCRSERHGGDGSVYKERWFVDACNEVRRRIIHSRESDLSQEEMLRAPVVIPYRPLKDPRDIRMLDPACGSMHFGLYAFDLYLKIYDEYWDLCHDSSFRQPATEHRLPTEEYADKAAWMKAAPKLIIEHNIHGIDIDPRAVQIAGLSLWLRAQRAWKSQGIAAGDRPQVTRSNVVCAEPMPGDQTQLAEFCKTLQPAIAQMVTAIFKEMKLAGEAGSLLKIEQEITGLVAAAKKQWEKEPKTTQLELFGADVVKEQQLEFDLSGITDQQFFEQAEETIYEALRKYANETSEGGFRKKLFAGDAEKGFAFIEVCRKRFDVALMNPPFGDASKPTANYQKQIYPNSSQDIFQCFVECCFDLLELDGRIGVLSARTGFFMGESESWRTEIVWKNQLRLFADLGLGVLDDALVEAAAYCLQKGEDKGETILASRHLSTQEKEESLLRSINNWSDVFPVPQKIIDLIPHSVFGYWAPTTHLKRFESNKSFEASVAKVRQGLATADDFRFARLSWEVSNNRIGPGKIWSRFSKGGEYSPPYDDIHLLVRWAKNGAELRSLKTARVQNDRFYHSEGATYTVRTASAFAAKILPADCIFSHNAQSWFPPERKTLEGSIFYCMCRVPQSYIELSVGGGDVATAGSAARRYTTKVLHSLPATHADMVGDEEFKKDRDAILQYIDWKNGLDETSCLFVGFQLSGANTVDEISRSTHKTWLVMAMEALEATFRIDNAVTEAFETTKQELEFVDNEIGVHPCNYPRSIEMKFDDCYKLSIEQLIEKGKVELGASRWITKKSYFVDRRLELISHIKKCHPGVLAKQWQGRHYADLSRDIVSHSVGLAFKRFSILLYGNSKSEFSRNPFAPLPQVSPATGNPDEAIGIFVDDPSSASDLSKNVSLMIEQLFPNSSNEVILELQTNLRTSLDDWLRRHFFEFHLSRYSKSRRSAPIYWPISTESGSYTLWGYYHRLTDQTLYKAVNDFVDPKLRDDVKPQLDKLRGLSSRSTAQEQELGQLTELESELEQFKSDLLEIAAFWKPNLNDGVQITAAPLWKFFRHTAWRNKLKKTWEELQEGKYDWAHLALSIWPERVVKEKCTTDRSIAIAHDLEDQLWHEVEVKKTSKTGRVTTKTEWQPRNLSDAELDAFVAKVKTR